MLCVCVHGCVCVCLQISRKGLNMVLSVQTAYIPGYKMCYWLWEIRRLWCLTSTQPSKSLLVHLTVVVITVDIPVHSPYVANCAFLILQKKKKVAENKPCHALILKRGPKKSKKLNKLIRKEQWWNPNKGTFSVHHYTPSYVFHWLYYDPLTECVVCYHSGTAVQPCRWSMLPQWHRANSTVSMFIIIQGKMGQRDRDTFCSGKIQPRCLV